MEKLAHTSATHFFLSNFYHTQDPKVYGEGNKFYKLVTIKPLDVNI